VGKTQIALEYAYRHALEYSAVFWIGAETGEQIVASLLHIAEVLQLPGRDDKDQQRVITVVQHWFAMHEQWLLIWDNVEDLALLDRFLPSIRSGAILITTRCQVLGTLARGLDLPPMKHEEGTLFLLRRAKMLDSQATSEQVRQFAARTPAHYAAAADLVTTMGGLPLALDQTGAYLEETHCGLPAYLDLFRNRGAVLLQQRGEGSRDHPASVSTTFALAIAATAQRHPAVWDLLRVCALLQPDAIPEELFRLGGEHLGGTLQAACRDALEWDRVIAITCGYSLLFRQPETQTLSMHRLVQAVLLNAMTKAEWERWMKRVIHALDTLFPDLEQATEHGILRQGERLLPHTLLCLPQAPQSLALASLAHKVAQYLHVRGRYVEATPLYQQALHIREQTQGPDHPNVASSLKYLATHYMRQGKYAEAEPLYRQTVHVFEQALGPNHPDVARVLNNLALLYAEQGKYTEAEPLYCRAIHILEQTPGPDRHYMANVLHNLALLYQMQDKDAEAEPLHQRELHIREQTQGPDHPDMASALNILAELYRRQGKYTEAEPLYCRAIHILEQALGPDHHYVAHPLNNLALLYWAQGKYTEAEPLYLRALHLREQTLGPDHPYVAHPLHNLANLYSAQGKYEQAGSLYQRALSIREQHLGQQHPETAQILHDLAVFWQKRGKLDEALNLAERALSIRSQSQGDAHPKTIASRTLLVQLLQEQTPTVPSPETDPQTIPTAQEKLPVPTINVAVRGATKQVAYTRTPRHMMLERGGQSKVSKNAWALENGEKSEYD